MTKNAIFLTALLLQCSFLFAQRNALASKDSLSGKSFQYFIEKLDADNLEKETSLMYSRAYLERAKRETNWNEMVNAYKFLLHLSGKEDMLAYSDSMVYAAKRGGDIAILGSAFLTKGIVYYDRKEYAMALDNYLIADGYISQSGDAYLRHKVKFNIAQIKYYLGFYDEAIALLKDCADYYKDRYERPYLISLHSLGLCYTRLKKYDVSGDYNRLGGVVAVRSQDAEMAAYFMQCEGINSYFRKKYKDALDKLQKSLQVVIDKNDFANETVGYFYIGKSYWALNQKEQAVRYFKKVDHTFTTKNYIRPDLRENYELLIRYYREHSNQELELLYVNRLLAADKILNSNYKYLSGKIFKEYDTKQLLRAKAEIENSLQQRKIMEVGLVALVVLLFGLLGYSLHRHKQNKKVFRRKFDELMSQSASVARESETRKPGTGNLDLNPDIVASVLKHLEKFEKNAKYLEPDMTLTKMAGIFDSNTKYVSRIIFHYRGKKSPEYINDLKIDHVIALLKTDNKYRLYTNKALGEEVGFATTQHFTRAFSNRTGMPPNYFIQELKKKS
jgi:AraC-like DNA-binding protein